MSKVLPCLALLMIVGCAYNYRVDALNDLSLGATKQEFVRQYSAQSMQRPVPRASKVTGNDTIEVMTLPLRDVDGKNADYWFVFKNSHLVQWGKPQDWKNVAATYQIDLNSAPGARSP